MKKSLLCLSVLFLTLTACRTEAPEQKEASAPSEAREADFVFDRDIYISVNGELVPANKEAVLEFWKASLGEDFPKGAEFDEWSLSSAREGEVETGGFITAKSSGSAVSIGAVLEIDEGRVYMSDRSKIATCRGCAEGCSLVADGSSIKCTGCDPTDGKGCVKSEHVKVSAKGA